MMRVKTIDEKKLFESIETYNFKETECTSQEMIKFSSRTNDQMFRIGEEALTVLSALKDKIQIKHALKTFKIWFEFCLKHEQKHTPKNSIINYGIMYCENLINKQLFDMANEFLCEMQQIYPFLCDNPYDNETERYIKYLAPLCFNQALNKELISKDVDSAIKFFQHGLKFYVKVTTNFYVLFNSIPIFEANFMRSPRFEAFYADLFEFLIKSIENKNCVEKLKTSMKHVDTQIFLRKFFLSLYIQYSIPIYSNDLSPKTESLSSYYDILKSSFDSFETKNDLIIAKEVLNILPTISDYSNQFPKSKSSRFLKKNSNYEQQLSEKFSLLFEKTVENKNFYNFWLLGNLFDSFVCSIENYLNTLNSLALHSKFLQERLIESLQKIAFLYSENSKHAFINQDQADTVSLSKLFFHKPLIFFNQVGKLIELQLKLNNQSKCEHSKFLKDSSESIISEQNVFIKWLIKFKVVGIDDMCKHYNLFENQTIRITDEFYSEKSISDFIKFQKQASSISKDHLIFLLNTDRFYETDATIKYFRSINENLVLSLRQEEKFSEALEEIKKVFDFSREFALDNEFVWLVKNWCKIKRDKWKSKKIPYNESQKKQTIVDYLEISNKSISLMYLFEEIRNYYNFKSEDSSISMHEEIFYALEKLENMETDDMIQRCRIYLEMALFNLNSSKEYPKFKLSSEEYCDLAKLCLEKHTCEILKISGLPIQDSENVEENKENDASRPQSHKKRLSSPTSDIMIQDDIDNSESARKLAKRRRIESPMPFKTESSVILGERRQHAKASLPKILQFQLNLYKSLCEYSKLRSKTLNAIKNLVDCRIKLEDSTNMLTNADNLNLKIPKTQTLISPELCDEFCPFINDRQFIKGLNSCLAILEKLKDKLLLGVDQTLEKQFYESIDLLAHFFGFLGLVLNRTTCLEIKLSIASKNLETHLDIFTHLEMYSNTIVHLMKSYLNSNQLKSFESLFDKLNLNKNDCSKKAQFKINDIELDALYVNNEFLSKKSEFRINFYLNVMHYWILKGKTKEAIKIMKDKILKSPILNGIQNAFYFEVKHYLKYLQFTLSMTNTSKFDQEFTSLIDHETPLSLLDECYSCIFSVAKYYTVNSIEPFIFISTKLTNDKSKDSPADLETKTNLDTIFFDIGSSESYRILSDYMDIQHHLCKHFIDIGRYRDSIDYICEGLDVTQLHFSLRRMTRFLLQQIHADIIANCFNESKTRLKLTEILIQIESIENSQILGPEMISDLMRLNNFTYFYFLSMLNDIRKNSDQEYNEFKGSLIILKKKFINKVIAFDSQVNDYIRETLIDMELMILNYLKRNKKNKTPVNDCIKNIKALLKKGSIRENWNWAEYLCIMYELDENNLELLPQAYSYIQKYPQPLLYRKILMHLYKSESVHKNELKEKCFYLLETQSIALRHKACSIQLKHKRKGTQDPKLIEIMLSNLSFNSGNHLDEFIEKILPDSCVVISLVLGESNDLYLARFEAKKSPVLIKLKYSKNLIDEFKTIMIENDRSMDQSDKNKYWSSRSALDKKLKSYLEEFESSVFSFYKSLLLGSLIDFNIEKIIDEFKEKFFSNSKLSKNQENLLRLLILGLEQFTFEDTVNCLMVDFSSEPIYEFAKFFFINIRPRLLNAKRKHVCLLIDKNLHQIPFECFPSTRSQSITRMPSIHFLQTHIKINSLSLNKEKAFYIVDPGCDLTHTRMKLQNFFEKRKSWDGIIGANETLVSFAPNETFTVFKKALTEYELFIYAGHGSGSQYYPSDNVQKLRVQACSILMGCSSGNQYVMGDFEPYGTVLAYILAGCPCFVGNLWDVTDQDIDRLTEEFLESWIKDHDEMDESMSEEEKMLNKNSILTSSICDHLNKARKACKFEYLTGSATVVYGLPVNFK